MLEKQVLLNNYPLHTVFRTCPSNEGGVPNKFRPKLELIHRTGSEGVVRKTSRKFVNFYISQTISSMAKHIQMVNV